MDFCSSFIDDLALFGKFPNEEQVEELEERGVSLFLDLTTEAEDLPLYSCRPGNQIFYYPIQDGRVPQDMKDFQIYIEALTERLCRGQKMYIHCKGGHGRSGVVVACLLRSYYNLDAEEALRLTNLYHDQRPVMDARWRHLGSPQTRTQKTFVRQFTPIYPRVRPHPEAKNAIKIETDLNSSAEDVIYLGQRTTYDDYMMTYQQNLASYRDEDTDASTVRRYPWDYGSNIWSGIID